MDFHIDKENTSKKQQEGIHLFSYLIFFSNSTACPGPPLSYMLSSHHMGALEGCIDNIGSIHRGVSECKETRERETGQDPGLVIVAAPVKILAQKIYSLFLGKRNSGEILQSFNILG